MGISSERGPTLNPWNCCGFTKVEKKDRASLARGRGSDYKKGVLKARGASPWGKVPPWVCVKGSYALPFHIAREGEKTMSRSTRRSSPHRSAPVTVESAPAPVESAPAPAPVEIQGLEIKIARYSQTVNGIEAIRKGCGASRDALEVLSELGISGDTDPAIIGQAIVMLAKSAPTRNGAAAVKRAAALSQVGFAVR